MALPVSTLTDIGRHLGAWTQDLVAVSQTAVPLSILGDATRFSRIAVKSGCILGIAVWSDAIRTNGTLIIEATINGVGTGFNVVLDGTHTQVDTKNQKWGLTPFAAGDRLGINITTDINWAPITANITVEMLVC